MAFERQNRPGKLFLIGAGPGDPELLTLKATRVLGQCDVILYDRLVNPDVLRWTRANTELIYVGKREGEQRPVQARIFSLILKHGRMGQTVGRLKGGDPFIFGRGGEELNLARQHGMDVEYVPGVSAALAGPGLAGVPLTLRQVSRGFAVVSGNWDDGAGQERWSPYAHVDTLVILMGVAERVAIARALITAGRSIDEPVLFVTEASLPDMRLVRSTLSAVAAGVVEVQGPAVFVVGRVVSTASVAPENS